MPRSFYKSSPLQSRQLSNVTIHSYDRVCKHLFFPFCKWMWWFFYPFWFVLHLEETFQSKLSMCWFSDPHKPWRKIRGISSICILFVRATMPFSMNIWEIIYLYMFWIFYFELLISLHRWFIRFLLAFNASVLFYLFCMSQFALMAVYSLYFVLHLYMYIPLHLPPTLVL